MAVAAGRPWRHCLPEVLRVHGYRTVFLQSAPLAFMQKDSFMPAIGFDGLPQLGATYDPKVTDAAPQTFALLASGLDRTVYQGIPLPAPLPNAPGCDLLVSADALDLVITDAAGAASYGLSVPVAPSLVGQELHHQWLVWDPSVNGLGIVTSNAGTATVQN